jgi:hypothetical protein
MVFGSFPNGEMEAMAVMEIVCDKAYFFGKGRKKWHTDDTDLNG